MPYIARPKLQEGFLLHSHEPDTLRQEVEGIIDEHSSVISTKTTDLFKQTMYQEEMGRLLS